MLPYTYLLINIATIFICFIASFDKRIPFYKHFGAFLISCSLVALPFIIWDIIFTKQGVWWFDFQYTLGIKILGLPLEEIMFFYCIPFACVFTYYCVDRYYTMSWTEGWNNILVFGLCILLTVVILLHYQKLYTLVTAIVTLSSLLYFHFIAKISWLTKATLIYILLFPGFWGVNGLLTGSWIPSPVVNYNSAEFLNIRMGTIPIEDFVYGYTMILWNLYFFKKLAKPEQAK